MAQPVVVDLRNIYRPRTWRRSALPTKASAARLSREVIQGCCHTPRMRVSSTPVFVISTAGVYWITAFAGDDGSETLPRSFDTPLPIDAVLDPLARTLANHNARAGGAAGAGKTTRVRCAAR